MQQITEQELIDFRTKIVFNLQYPSKDMDVNVFLRRYNIDDLAQKKIVRGDGFIIKSSQKIKNDVTGKNENSIFSPKFGKTLNDINNPMSSDYKCSCGETIGHIYEGHICPKCKTRIELRPVDFSKFGYIPTYGYPIIHPNLYRSIETYLGAKILTDILIPEEELSIDGTPVEKTGRSSLSARDQIKKSKRKSKATKKRMLTETKASADNPFLGIGMLGFYERFDEILDYYYPKKQKAAKEIYLDIKKERKNVFCHYVSVYTTQLRPFSVNDNVFNTEGNNKSFQNIASLSNMLKNHATRYGDNRKGINRVLWRIQDNWNDIYDDNEKALAGKKGDIRECMSARVNFSVRSIIVPAIDLEMDEIRLPYAACMELLRFHIINILKKSYSYNYSQAYYEWYKAKIAPNPIMKELMMNIIRESRYGGLPILFNRNPTIQYGSILMMKCIGITDSYSMQVNSLCLRYIAGDYDGDTINNILLLNDDIIKRALITLNPVNAMIISKNDGTFNPDANLQTESLITINTIRHLAERYSEEEEAMFADCLSCAPA